MAREVVPSVDTSVDDAINALQNNDADTDARLTALETIVDAISQGETFSQLVLSIVANAGYVIGGNVNATVPDAPSEVLASSPNGNDALVSFTPGDDGGSAIISYQVLSDTGYSVSGISSPLYLQQLPAGPYNFTVVAINAIGTSAASESVFLNVTNAPAPLPDPPTNVIAAGGAGSVSLIWTPPANTGGVSVEGYNITSFGPTQITTTASIGSSATITGLSPGSYSFSMQTFTANGVSILSAGSNVVLVATTNTVPDAPISVSATGGTLQSSVTFVAPANNGGTAITGYLVTSSSGASSSGTSSPIVVNESLVGSYSYTVQAINAIGTSIASASSNTVTVIGTAPGVPTSVVATGQILQALVSFSSPINTGGSGIIGYTVTSSSGTTANGTYSPITVTEASAGNYTYSVTATNAYGTSASSASSSSVTVNPAVTVPAAPTGVTAVGGVLQSTVTFTAPTNTGGGAITGYVVTSSSGATTSGSAFPITIGESAAGSYSYTVHAINSAGAGANSTASTSVTVTALSVPGAPTSVVATGGSLQSSVAFVAPASNGGSAITSYTATSSSGATQSGTSSPLVVTETNAGSYTYTVKATNAIGSSVASTASSAVTVSAVVPTAPLSVNATGGVLQSTVTFTAPSSNGGASITSYSVLSSSGATATGSTSPITVTESAAGTYTYKVRAINSAGNGPYSALTSGTTVTTNVTVPGAPTGVTATGGTLQATVSFTAPSSNGNATITSYTVASSSGSTASGTASPIIIGEVAAGSYTYVVRAVNSAGSSAASTASAPTTVVPVSVSGTNLLPSTTADTSIGASGFFAVAIPGTAPTLASDSTIYLAGTTSLKATAVSANPFYITSVNFAAVTPGQSITLLAWVRPGTATSSGRLSVNYFNSSFASISSSAIASADTSLPNTTWTGLAFTTTVPTGAAYANIQINIDTAPTASAIFNFDNLEIAVGSTVNTWSAGITVPGAPTSVVATPGALQSSVAFTAPAINGGATITSYTVTSSSGATASGSASPIVVTETSAGSYTYTAKATNYVGSSSASTASSAVTVVGTVPGTPTSVVATPGSLQSSVAFTAPTFTGGVSITGYSVLSSSGATATGTSSPIVVTEPAAGTFTYTVKAINSVGTGSASTASAAVTVNPAAGTNLVANPSSAIDSTGVSQNNNVASTVATRVTGLTPHAGGGSTTGYAVTIAPSNTYSYLLAPINYSTITVGSTVNMSAWVNLGTGSGSVGIKIANVSNTGTISGDTYYTTIAANAGWVNLTLTTTATTAGSSGDGLFVDLPKSPSATITAQITDLSVSTGTPGAPTGIAATGGVGTASVSFTPPTNTGSSAITSYTVTLSN